MWKKFQDHESVSLRNWIKF